MSVVGRESKRGYAKKEVGALPVAGPVSGSEEQQRTNEIGMAIPSLAACDVEGKDIAGDAPLTQRSIAGYMVGRKAHCHFTVKGNQPALEQDIALQLETRGAPDCVEVAPPDHGRVETRSVWCSAALNGYLDFSHVGQVFRIEREMRGQEDRSAQPRRRAVDREPHAARGVAGTHTGR
jgi:hypothetical protein